MVLRLNDSDSFPGAAYVAADPILISECCAENTIAELAAAASAGGQPYTIKGARLFVDADAAEIAALCDVGEPAITSVDPDPIVDGSSWLVFGSNFGPAPGTLWLANAATWAGSTIRIEQNVGGWLDTGLNVGAPIMDGLPFTPANVYVYVINQCGDRNAVGFTTGVVVL